ncbi:MAG: DOMON-like domain-containing protein, partial [Caulobacteraceae bacterium]
MRTKLTPHPAGASSPIEAVEVEVERIGQLLWLRFFTEGDVNAVAWPGPSDGGRADELWKHTCFEAF